MLAKLKVETRTQKLRIRTAYVMQGPVGSRAGACGKLYRGLWEAMQGPVGSRAGACWKSCRGLWEVIKGLVGSCAKAYGK